MDATRRTALTYRYERLRAAAHGILESGSTTFLLLIAVKWFHAGPFAKGLIAAGSGLGYLLSPLVVAAVESARAPVARASAWICLAGGLTLAAAAVIPAEGAFVLASLLSVAAMNAVTPLLTQIYQDNYPDAGRGRFFSRTIVIRIGTLAFFSLAAGRLLGADITYFRWLLWMLAASLLFSAWCLAQIPSTPLHLSGGRHPLRALKYATDPLFRLTLISWMFMGFANLMMLPLRVEYLANPRYGLALSAQRIALLTGFVPNIARLVMSPVWGHLFDRANFFVLRIALNIGFAIGITSFFVSDSTAGLIIAAIAYGISVAGGDVAWSLWVTKVAPPERVADYMSVHTFFTGVRGLIAPLAGFALVARWSMAALGWFSAALILVGTVCLLPEVGRGSELRRGSPGALPADGGEN
jgi:hypothetical protein